MKKDSSEWSGGTDSIGLCCIFPLVVPLVPSCKEISLLRVVIQSGHNPPTQWLWAEVPTFLIYGTISLVHLEQSLSLGRDKSLVTHSTLLSSCSPWPWDVEDPCVPHWWSVKTHIVSSLIILLDQMALITLLREILGWSQKLWHFGLDTIGNTNRGNLEKHTAASQPPSKAAPFPGGVTHLG